MEKYKGRKKIIDNTSVPLARRHYTQASFDLGKNTSVDIHNKDKNAGLIRNNLDGHKRNSMTSERFKAGHSGKAADEDSSRHSDVIEVYIKDSIVKKEVNVKVHQNLLNPLMKIRSKTLPDLTNGEKYIDNNRSDQKKNQTDTVENGLDSEGKRIVDLQEDILKYQNQTKEIRQDFKRKGPFKSSVIISKDSSSVADTLTTDAFDNINSVNARKQTLGTEIHIEPERRFERKPDVSDELEYHPSIFGAKLFDLIHDADDENDVDDERADDETGDGLIVERLDANGGKYPTQEAFSNMTDKPGESPRLLSVEEKWQIIFTETNRAPIYAVGQYIDYLNKFVHDKKVTSSSNDDLSKKNGISPVTYLLRKLKLDLKMSYDSFIEEFLSAEKNGLELLVKLLKSIQNTGSQQSGSTNMSQLKNYKKTLTDEHDCLLCIKFSLRLQSGLLKLLEIPYGLETVSMGLLSTFTKSRGTAIEILTVTLSEAGGFSRSLDCFTFIRLKIGEPVRFKSLMNMMNLDSQQNFIFKVSCMKFLNSLLDCSPTSNYRIFLQHEMESAGLDVCLLRESVEGRTGLEFDDLRHELDQWDTRYVSVDEIVSKKALPTQHQQHLIDELKVQVQVLSKEKSYLERQLTAVSTELRNRYEELHRKAVMAKDACVQCEGAVTQTKSIGCQCSDFDDFGNPLKTAALYFGWQETNENDVMKYYDYQINLQDEGDGAEEENDDEDEEEEESETDHVVKVEDWLRTRCDSPELDLDPICLSVDENDDSRQYFRRQYSIRHKPKNKSNFSGNWKLYPKPISNFAPRYEGRQCHSSKCDRCNIASRQENMRKVKHTNVPVVPRDLHRGVLCAHKLNVQLESQSSDSAIGGSGDRLWNVNGRFTTKHPTVKSEEERLQDLITPDDSASACPEAEPVPDYSSVTTRSAKKDSYQAELSEVLREFEGHLSRYDTPQEFVDMSRSPHHLALLGNV